MKLITFQTLEAFQELKEKGVLQVPDAFSNANSKKYNIPYYFMIDKMKRKIPDSEAKYPIWAWEKCGAFVAPRKRKNILDIQQKTKVKITFFKPDEEVLVSDYMAYSFILSGHIVPESKAEYTRFFNELKKQGIPLDELKLFVRQEKVSSSEKIQKVFPKIQKSWNRIFDLKSDVHQACIWDIKWSEVEKAELCNNPKYLYGSMNTLRKDGTRPDWKKEYLKFID